MPDQDGFPTNAEITAVYNLLGDDGAFVNPNSSHITVARDAITDQTPKLEALEAIGDPTGITDWEESDFTDVLALLPDLDTALVNFQDHTDRTSGVDFNDGFITQKADLNALLSVSVAIADLDEKTGESTTDTITQFFSSLTTGPTQIFQRTFFLIDLDLKIQELAPYDSTPHPLPSEVLSNISTFISYLDDLRTTENTNYDNAIKRLRRWGMASALKSPNEVWRDFVVDNISTTELAPLIPELEE